MFDVGRFREETMAFPPGVTVKDYFPDGYLNPKTGNRTRAFPHHHPDRAGAAADRSIR